MWSLQWTSVTMTTDITCTCQSAGRSCWACQTHQRSHRGGCQPSTIRCLSLLGMSTDACCWCSWHWACFRLAMTCWPSGWSCWACQTHRWSYCWSCRPSTICCHSLLDIDIIDMTAFSFAIQIQLSMPNLDARHFIRLFGWWLHALAWTCQQHEELNPTQTPSHISRGWGPWAHWWIFTSLFPKQEIDPFLRTVATCNWPVFLV